jgi:ferritin-like metal-binding protein YciE
MNISTLKEIYLTELQETRSVDAQLTQALPKMSDMAHDGGAKRASCGDAHTS